MDPDRSIQDTTEVLLAKLPVGSTTFYLNTLAQDNLQEKDLANFRDIYERLVWNATLRHQLLRTIIDAIGKVEQLGMLWWKSFVPTIVNTKALKIFLELLLVDNSLLTLLLTSYTPDMLRKMQLQYHLLDEQARAAALNFLEFIVRQKPFENYTIFIEDPEACALATTHFQNLKKPVNVTLGNEKKRGRSSEVSGGETPDKKIKLDAGVATRGRRKESGVESNVHWYWAADAEGEQDTWMPYDHNISDRIEKAFLKKQKKKKIDNDRYIDFISMTQKRYDNPAKIRKIKRVE